MSKPDFIGVGTERAGTSWLFSMIAHHPESWVPPLKELHFLDTIDPDVPSHNPRYRWHLTSRIKQKATPFMNISHRPEFLKNTAFEYLLWDACYFSGSMNFEWYQRLFAERFVKGRIAGEYTPAYCNISEALIKKMLELNPYMKFLLVFRHPCQQIRSSLIQHFVMIENRPFASVGEDEMMEWLCAPFAQKKSNIGDVFEKWSRCLPQDQLFIGLYEEIKQAPEELIKRVYRFLGLNESFMPDRKFYANKINNLTKPDYIIPQIVLDYIDEHWGREAEHIQKHAAAGPILEQFMSSKISSWEEQGNKHINIKGKKHPLPYHKIISDLAIQYSQDGDAVLDIGCGLGQTVALIQDKGQREIHIADAYENCLEITCNRISPQAEYLIDERNFDISNKIQRTFKVVIMSHVLEHMLNPVQAVHDALGLVEDGGYLILAVPNPARPGVLISNITKTHYVNRGHVMTWDMSHWINFLENILKLDVVEYRNDFIQIKGCNSLPAIMSLGETLGRVLPWWCFSNIAVIRK